MTLRTPRQNRFVVLTVAAVLVATALPLGLAPPAGAMTGLGWYTTPGDVTFPSLTLDGVDHSVSAQLAMDVASSVTTGWNITMTSTTFSTTSGHSLPTGATQVLSEPSVSCDSSGGMMGSCTLAVNEAAPDVSFPYTLPAGSSPPSATEMFDAASNTGDGNQTVTPTFTVTVPAYAYAGTYTSTWTISLVSGP